MTALVHQLVPPRDRKTLPCLWGMQVASNQIDSAFLGEENDGAGKALGDGDRTDNTPQAWPAQE